ncbi:hypothetical protein GWK47_026175 [Chionoecetes opilio]|uniref:Endonuclease/exonuclease/phosphatase domain-containing protein n=1 Tax=Chionoecetes opilio TaxID=41210 RepID=A0A8J8WET1_CHIOP|nr:hypothetical protein GWK47_026175 [Chionoecetes opilio]
MAQRLQAVRLCIIFTKHEKHLQSSMNIRDTCKIVRKNSPLINELDPEIICLQEKKTMIGQGKVSLPTGFIPVQDTTSRGGGVSGGCGLTIRVGCPLNCSSRVQSPLQAVAGRIHLHKTYTVCHQYIYHPNDDIPLQDLRIYSPSSQSIFTPWRHDWAGYFLWGRIPPEIVR